MNRAVTSLNGGSLEITLTVPFSKDEIIEKFLMKCIIQILRNIYVYSSYTYKGCLIDWLIITFRFEKLFGVEECLQHPLIKQHISHWFRDNNVYFFREIYLFYLPWDNLDQTRDLTRNIMHFPLKVISNSFPCSVIKILRSKHIYIKRPAGWFFTINRGSMFF